MKAETFAQIHEAFLKSYHGEDDFEYIEREIAYSPKSQEYKALKKRVEEILVGDTIQPGRSGLLKESQTETKDNQQGGEKS